jgi:hypothetical protein
MEHDMPMAFSVREAARELGTSPRQIRDALYKTGTLVGRRLGTRVIIADDELQRFRDALPIAVAKPRHRKEEEVPHDAA